MHFTTGILYKRQQRHTRSIYVSEKCRLVAGTTVDTGGTSGQLCAFRFLLTTIRSTTNAATMWNSLPDSLENTALSLSCFHRHLEIILYSCY